MAFLNILKFFYLLNQSRYGYQITQMYFRVYSSNNEKMISKQLSRMSMRKKFTFFPHNFDFFQGSKFFRNFSSKCFKLLQNKKFWLLIGCQVHTTWGLFALNWERRNSLYFGDRADNVWDFWFFTSFLTPFSSLLILKYTHREKILCSLSHCRFGGPWGISMPSNSMPTFLSIEIGNEKVEIFLIFLHFLPESSFSRKFQKVFFF